MQNASPEPETASLFPDEVSSPHEKKILKLLKTDESTHIDQLVELLGNEMTRFLQIARGSASKTEYHLLLAKDLGFLQEGDFRAAEQDVIVVQKMLTALVQKVQPRGRKSKAEQPQEGL